MLHARASLLLLALAPGCERTASGGDDPQSQPPVRITNPFKVHFHMRRRVDDLREVERLLVSGKLEDARARAFLLTEPVADPGLSRLFIESTRLADAAKQLASAPDLWEACRREARVAQMCAECHARAHENVRFPKPPPAPSDDPNAKPRMALHAWAFDRLWEGMIGSSLGPWRTGLDVLAAAPLATSSFGSAPKLAERLQLIAREGIAKIEDRSDTLDSRAHTYGELLVTCTGCHATGGRNWSGDQLPPPQVAGRP
jgi:cytochrome c553